MRWSLALQLVLAIMGLTLLVLLATLLLARWSFERSFVEYVGALERTRLQAVGEALLEAYDPSLGWTSVTEREFQRAVRVLPLDSRRSGPPLGRPAGDRRGPGDREIRVQTHPAPARRPPPPRGPASRLLPTALFDADDRLLMAFRAQELDESEDWVEHSLTLNGAIIGSLRSLPRVRLEGTQETVFSRQQRTASIAIFCVAMLFALALSLLLARRLLKPLRLAQGALGRLADGNYGESFQSRRRDELGDLVRDIDKLSMTLDRNRDARQRWIADISHELRTPIALLKGELEAIADGIRRFDETQLVSLQAEVERLAKLVDDLYQLSLADVGGLRYEFSSLNITELLQGLLAEQRHRFEGAGLRMSSELAQDLVINGDAQRLDQLFLNLLENSRAYTDSPGQIHVCLRSTDASVLISIEDSAPGVEESLLDQLFDPLFRTELSRSRRTAGAGLGLAICRAVVEAHSGTISAETSSLGGLVVEICLPRGD
ncbi:MAG: ATP-binding protein [Pseudomonadota bacterium]